MRALPDPRKKLLRLIHVARRDLRMDENTYRDILQKITGKASASDMTVPELEKTLEHFKRCGFRIRHTIKTHGKRRAVSSMPLAQDPDSRKIRALWLFMHELGLVRNASERALAGYVKRITGVDALQWIDSNQANTVIES
ncbi:MAG: regulatory protein GemA, partial [Oxalobacter formigenes]|nr:regulatory protein GemA [Oxalobacter formigenes]